MTKCLVHGVQVTSFHCNFSSFRPPCHMLAVYYVKERCQDGWFKGINRSQKSGVFPGNYVTPLRSIHTDAAGSAASTASNQHRRTAHSQSSSAGHSASHKNGKSDKGPPELPPRLIASSTPAPSSSSSVWSKPIGQHVEALFGRKSINLYRTKSSHQRKGNKSICLFSFLQARSHRVPSI